MTYMQSPPDDFACETHTQDRTFKIAGTVPRLQPKQMRDNRAIAIPVVFALLFAVSFGLFGVGAITTAPRAAAEFASSSSQIAKSTASSKINLEWQFASGPDYTCDVCDAHHGGLHHPNYCHDCIDKGDTPVLPDYGFRHGR
jgi:hypothetical protein